MNNFIQNILIENINNYIDIMTNTKLGKDEEFIKYGYSFDYFVNLKSKLFNDISYYQSINLVKRTSLMPYIELAEYSLFNHLNIYDNLIKIFKEQKPWNHDSKLSKYPTDLTVMLLYKNLTTTLESIINLYIKGLEFQSLQLLRCYIELSALITLFLLDKDFAIKFLEAPKDKEDYRKYWHNNLKPNKIQKKLQSLRDEVLKYEKISKITTMDLRKQTNNITSKQRDYLYKMSADYIHYNLITMLNHSYSKNNNGYNISIHYNKSDLYNQRLVNIVEYSFVANETIINMMGLHTNFISSDTPVEFINFVVFQTYLKSLFIGFYKFGEDGLNL